MITKVKSDLCNFFKNGKCSFIECDRFSNENHYSHEYVNRLTYKTFDFYLSIDYFSERVTTSLRYNEFDCFNNIYYKDVLEYNNLSEELKFQQNLIIPRGILIMYDMILFVNSNTKTLYQNYVNKTKS